MKYTDKHVLVTGGAGFIGSNLVKRLVSEGAVVTVIDDLFTGKLSSLTGVNCDFIKGTVNDCSLIRKLLIENTIVFHLASRNIIASTSHPREDCETNTQGTLNILLNSLYPRIDKLVYTSSASVYGNPRYLPINEDDTIVLLTPYAVSKYGGEGYCMAFHENYGIPVTILRLSNVYGPGQSPDNPYCGVVSKFMQKANKKEPLEIHGDGQSTRDFTYIDDVIEAIMLAGLSNKSDGEVYNVATGIETSINELAGNVLCLYPYHDNTLLYNHETDMNPIVHVDRRDIDNIRRRVLNTEKIRRKLHWIPTITLREGLSRTKSWYDKQV